MRPAMAGGTRHRREIGQTALEPQVALDAEAERTLEGLEARCRLTLPSSGVPKPEIGEPEMHIRIGVVGIGVGR